MKPCLAELIIMLLFTGYAVADEPVYRGGVNASSIEQVGPANTAYINTASPWSNASIRQVGYNNEATQDILHEGMLDVLAHAPSIHSHVIEQFGANNYAEQIDNGSVREYRRFWERPYQWITQGGEDATVSGNVAYQLTDDSRSFQTIGQYGDGNRAEQRIEAVLPDACSEGFDANVQTVLQWSDKNNAFMKISGGTGNTAMIMQGIPAVVNQIGHHHAAISIAGSNNMATITQAGIAAAESWLDQSQFDLDLGGKAANYAAITIEGSNNRANIAQKGVRNYAEIAQHTDNGISIIIQNGNGNRASITQNGPGVVPTVEQNGNDAIVNVLFGGK